MLPIDEHAKSGVWVWGLSRSGATLRKIKWDAKEPLPGSHWVCTQGMIFDDDAFTHYLPASWVENAVAMREALSYVDQCIYSNDYAEPALTTDFDQGKLDEALYATEWPPKQGKMK